MNPEDVKRILLPLRLYTIFLVPTVVVLSVLGYAIFAIGVVIPVSLICVSAFIGSYGDQPSTDGKAKLLPTGQGTTDAPPTTFPEGAAAPDRRGL